MYCKNCKKHTVNTFPKKNKIIMFISKNEIKGKSKCAICLTKRSFIHESEGNYELENELQIYLQFFTD